MYKCWLSDRCKGCYSWNKDGRSRGSVCADSDPFISHGTSCSMAASSNAKWYYNHLLSLSEKYCITLRFCMLDSFDAKIRPPWHIFSDNFITRPSFKIPIFVGHFASCKAFLPYVATLSKNFTNVNCTVFFSSSENDIRGRPLIIWGRRKLIKSSEALLWGEKIWEALSWGKN